MIKNSKKNLTTKNKSVILALKAKNLIDDSLLVCINSLTLEDLIAIKLELSANYLNNRPDLIDVSIEPKLDINGKIHPTGTTQT